MYNVGASSELGTVRAFEAPNNLGGAKITDQPTSALETRMVEFSVAPIDELLSNIETASISFIKIDVEGHEIEALKGASKTLQKHSPVIVFEQQERGFYNEKSNIVKFLQDQEYLHFYFLKRYKTYRTPQTAPLVLRRLGQLFESLIFGLPSEKMYLQVLSKITPRYYSMIIASKAPLVQENANMD